MAQKIRVEYHLTGILFLFTLTGCGTAVDVTGVPRGDIITDVPALTEQAGTPLAEPDRPPTPDPALVSLGAAVYAQQCAVCHGENLEGEADWKLRNTDGSFRPPPHDDTGHTWHHSDRLLREAILEGGARLGEVGTSPMPAFAGTLSEREVEAVLAYIKSTWPEEIRTIQWEQTVNDPGAASED